MSLLDRFCGKQRQWRSLTTDRLHSSGRGLEHRVSKAVCVLLISVQTRNVHGHGNFRPFYDFAVRTLADYSLTIGHGPFCSRKGQWLTVWTVRCVQTWFPNFLQSLFSPSARTLLSMDCLFPLPCGGRACYVLRLRVSSALGGVFLLSRSPAMKCLSKTRRKVICRAHDCAALIRESIKTVSSLFWVWGRFCLSW